MKRKLFTILVAVIAIVGATQIYTVAKPYNNAKTPPSDNGGGSGSFDDKAN